MLSNRPYLVRAFFQWIVDSSFTPILIIDAHNPRCKIPKEYVEGDEILFNISSAAVRDLKITNELIEFKASFSGVIHVISAPINAALAVYAEENGEGIFFDAEEDGESDDTARFKGAEISTRVPSLDPGISSAQTTTKSKPFLRLVE